jgi:uncharacterized protein involved in type VI secretion and phage assembly
MATTQYTQANRQMSLSTPLGTDVLLLQNLTYSEELGRPFEMSLEMQSTNQEIDFSKILGQSVTVTMNMPNGSVRYLNGIVRKFKQIDFNSPEGLFGYRAEVVPWISMLELTSNCQAYQNQTIHRSSVRFFRASISAITPSISPRITQSASFACSIGKAPSISSIASWNSPESTTTSSM